MATGNSQNYGDNNRTLWSAAQLLSVELVNRLSRNHKRYGEDYEPAADKHYVFQLARQIQYKQYSFEQVTDRLVKSTELGELSETEGETLDMSLMVLQQQIDNSLSELHQQLLEFDMDRLADAGIISLLDEQRQLWSVNAKQPIMQQVIASTQRVSETRADTDHNPELTDRLKQIRQNFDRLLTKLKDL